MCCQRESQHPYQNLGHANKHKIKQCLQTTSQPRKPYKHQHADVCSAALRSHCKETYCGTAPSLPNALAALPLVTDCGYPPLDASNQELATHSITSSGNCPDSHCRHWESGEGALLEAMGSRVVFLLPKRTSPHLKTLAD